MKVHLLKEHGIDVVLPRGMMTEKEEHGNPKKNNEQL